MSVPEARTELTDAEIRVYVDTFACPRCLGEVEHESTNHERDSSYDWIYCPKCGWRLPEMALWPFERGER